VVWRGLAWRGMVLSDGVWAAGGALLSGLQEAQGSIQHQSMCYVHLARCTACTRHCCTACRRLYEETAHLLEEKSGQPLPNKLPAAYR